MYKFQPGGIFQRFNYNNIYQNSHEDIKELQRALGIKDDGMIGTQTISALQNKIGTKADGIWGKNSITAANNFLSQQKIQNVPQKSQPTAQNLSVVSRVRDKIGNVKDRVTGAISGFLNSDSQQTSQNQPIVAAGMENVPNVESTQQTASSGSSFGRALSRAMSSFGMHNSQNTIPVQEAPYDPYNGMSSKEYLESIPRTSNLDVNMTKNIPLLSRIANMAVTIPEHGINQITGRVLMPLFGQDGNQIASEVESAKTPEEKVAAREKLWNVPGYTGATQAEKADMVAALTYLNGNKPMTYSDYLTAVKSHKLNAGDWLGSDYNTKSRGNSYTHMNLAEDAMGTKNRQIEVSDSDPKALAFLKNIYNAGQRIWDTPNRGRYGGWQWRVNENGDIEIRDAFEATEEQAARGRNDSDSYNAARDSWQRGTTHKLGTTISTDEQARYVRRGLNQ